MEGRFLLLGNHRVAPDPSYPISIARSESLPAFLFDLRGKQDGQFFDIIVKIIE